MIQTFQMDYKDFIQFDNLTVISKFQKLILLVQK